MSLLFSAVSVTAEDGSSAEFLVGGIPRDCDDLDEWDAFVEFAEEIDTEQEVRVHAEAFIYGEGETEHADRDEINELSRRIEKDHSFLAAHCDSIEEVDFSFVWSPEELFGMEME